MTLPPEIVSGIRRAVAEHGGVRAAMLEALRLIQHAEGWVSDARLAAAAELLGVTTAELDSVATFYSMIFRRPVGARLILLCDGAVCHLNGADAVRDAVVARLGINPGETTADGTYTLLSIACVGGCDRAPAAVLGRDRKLTGPVFPDNIDALLADAG
jgi:NADH-quinone oxidoreductase subunit E